MIKKHLDFSKALEYARKGYYIKRKKSSVYYFILDNKLYIGFFESDKSEFIEELLTKDLLARDWTSAISPEEFKENTKEN